MSHITNVATFLLNTLTNPNYVGNISDTTSDIVNNLGSLNGELNSVGSINASNGTVMVGVSALKADQGVLDKITGGFGLSDTAANIDSDLSQITADSGIVSVTGTDGEIDVTAGAFKANQTGLDKITGGFVVMDTAANISANLDQLSSDPTLVSIEITDDNPLSVSMAQLTSDRTALNKTRNADLSQYHLAVTDTAGNIEAGLALIQAAPTVFSSVTATDGPVIVSVATFNANTAALDTIVGGFVVRDTLANLVGDIVGMAADSDISHVMPTDGTPVVTTATFASYRALADKVVGGFIVSDTAANILANLATLGSDPNIMSVMTTDVPIATDVATFTAQKSILDKVTGGFSIADTATNVMGSLASLAADPAITGITATGGSVTSSVATFLASQSGLDKIAGGFSVTDTAAAIQGALAAIVADPNVTSIGPIGGSISAPVALFVSSASALAKIVGGYAVSDAASAISSVLDQLANPLVTSVTISDNGAISLTIGQMTTDAAVLAKTSNASGGALQFAVVDTAAHVLAAVATLPASVASITATGGPLSVTMAQLTANQSTLDKIAGGFKVTDTAAAIQSGLSTLAGDAAHVTSIASTDRPVIVSYASFVANKSTLDKIAGRFGVMDTASTLSSNLSTILADHAVASTTTLAFGLAASQEYYNLDGSLQVSDTISGDGKGNLVYHCFNGSLLAGKPYTSFDNVVNSTNTLLSQTLYDSTGTPLSQTVFNANGTVNLAGAVTKLASGDLDYHFAGGSFFTGKVFTSYDQVTSAAGVLKSQTYHDANGVVTQALAYNPDGSLALQDTMSKLPNGNYDYHYAGGSFFNGKSFTAFDNVISPGGVLQSQTLYNASGLAFQQTLYNANGTVNLQNTATVLPNGNIDYHFAGGTFFSGKSFTAFDNVTSSSGALVTQTLLDATGSPLQQTTYNPNGSMYQQVTISRPAAGQVLNHFANGTFFTGKSFSAFDNLATTSGSLLDQELYNNNGSHTFTVPGSNLTLTAAGNDTFNVTGKNETVRFGTTGFGADTFNGYKAGDTFSFAPSVFSSYASLAQHVTGTTNAVITDAANDTLTLTGVAPSSLTAGMFKFA